jgi:hypothetical protein
VLWTRNVSAFRRHKELRRRRRALSAGRSPVEEGAHLTKHRLRVAQDIPCGEPQETDPDPKQSILPADVIGQRTSMDLSAIFDAESLGFVDPPST